ncbi:MAG: response regulator [Paenibacillus sp.]|jgi:two-component system response regulator YesN|nr:response regulator [Paenibacillus sp.]
MKILIVDDEPRHRRGMKNMIQALRPADLVMVANDGAAALELIRQERPDVVLTDIRMPNMDGLEFLGMLENDTAAKPKVVMVSAYDRFEYAQTAMRHGAYDYLLKPVDGDKVENLLQRVEATLCAETLRDSQSEVMLREAASAYKKRLLLSWLNGGLTEAERGELAQLEWLQAPGIVMLTQLQRAANGSADGTTGALIADMERVCAPYGEACILPLDAPGGDSCELLTLLPMTALAPEDEDRLHGDLRSISAAWRKHGRLCHSIGSARASLREEGQTALGQARTASACRFYEQRGDVLLGGGPAGLPEYGAAIDSEALFDALQDMDAEAAITMCKQAFEQLAEGWRLPPTSLKEHATLLLMKIKSRNREHVERQVGSELTQAAVTGVPACRTYRELLDLMEAKLRELHAALHAGKEGSDKELSEECVNWIAEHRKEPITLESAAERFFFNPSYFSTWIKNHTGRTFTEHLLEARMDSAARLLEDNRLKIYEIAAECGYADTKYFCRVFKKRFGLSPERHRQMSLLQRRNETS